MRENELPPGLATLASTHPHLSGPHDGLSPRGTSPTPPCAAPLARYRSEGLRRGRRR
jgi:hypothetical protein